MAKELGVSYKAYICALNISNLNRIKEEKVQKEKLKNNNLKILLLGHSYNLHDDLIGKPIIKYLEENNITIIYSNKIDKNIVNSECSKLTSDLHFTYNKEIMASANYYKDKVNEIIIISSFPCGPDSLCFEDLNSEAGVITRLESFIDIIKNIKVK